MAAPAHNVAKFGNRIFNIDIIDSTSTASGVNDQLIWRTYMVSLHSIAVHGVLS